MVKMRKPKMAGNQVAQNPEKGILNPSGCISMKGKWQVNYARFFNYPSLPSTCPNLRPMVSRCKSKNPFGNWVSTSSVAFLQLSHDPSSFLGGGMVLLVSFLGKIYEEHYISQLLFSWPHVQCQEECLARGSRVLFATYKDSLGQVQKFAMRFSASSDLQTFLGILKSDYRPLVALMAMRPSCLLRSWVQGMESLKNGRNVGLKDRGLQSEIPSPSEFISSNGCDNRLRSMLKNNYCFEAVEELSNANSVEKFQCQVQPSESMQFTCFEYRTQGRGPEASCSTLPASFTALLSDSCTATEQEPPNIPEAFDLQSKVVGFMTSSPFNEFLCKLEMIIEELGGDLALCH